MKIIKRKRFAVVHFYDATANVVDLLGQPELKKVGDAAETLAFADTLDNARYLRNMHLARAADDYKWTGAGWVWTPPDIIIYDRFEHCEVT